MAPEQLVAPLVNGRPTMDGVRRNVPTPRELLAQMTAAEIAAEAAAPSLIPEREPRDWQRVQQTASFGLVATALATAGVVTAATAAHTTAHLASPARAASLAIGQPGAVKAVVPVGTGLQSLVNSLAAASPNLQGIYVKNLSTGEVASIGAGTSIESASMYKLFVANEVFHRIDLGQVSLGQVVPGTGQSVATCLRLMITISDNTCGRGLRSMVGLTSNNAAVAADGFSDTNLTGDYPQTSAGDIGTLYERLYNGTLNSPSSNASFLALLKGQLVNNRLPQGLPAGTVIAHKTGDLDGYMHDGGIVYGSKADYIVVVMGVPGAHPSDFVNLSQQLWNHFEQ
jgi:beta-lactamase class A